MGELANGGEADVPPRIDTLVSWAVAHGATLHPAVDVYDDAQTGLSFRVKPSAQRPLQPFEPVVRLPTSLALSYLNALADEGPRRFARAFLADAPPHVVGRLFLAKEYLAGTDSFWWPYIQALPQPLEPERWALPPFWPADEAELLEGTNLEASIDKIRRDVEREWTEARELLRQHGDDELSGKALTATLYQWAYCVFSSRSFRAGLVLSEAQLRRLPEGVAVDDFSVLMPLLDVGNHDMTTEVRWDVDDASQTCDFRVGKAHVAGEQIFNNYSMKTNAELLLGYGFMVPPTPDLHNDYTHLRKRTAATPVASDEYLISLRPLSDPSSLLGRSKQTLRFDPATPVLGAFRHVPPDMAWDIFCTLTPPAQRERLMPAAEGGGDDARRDSFVAGRVVGEGRLYLEQTVAVIQHEVLQELERLDETDVEVVGGDWHLLTGNQKLALDYRERCRQVLENTLSAMSQDELLNDVAEEQ
ncbi:Protein-lysine N-methyltransferase EFM1 [Tolypocladium capitatum]|uniref:Protein-lysine N-methyltransferase EFM1 n=1 Tax=Tolypocladium capitatum TaxID=45235 RepID=A0A2K3Q8E3_9HYPO|nr:Protein-lysine N-methyltransferase EFM1 [Tolypocladium capitatum]